LQLGYVGVGSYCRALRSVAGLAQKLDVPSSVAAASDDWNYVIEFQAFSGTTLDTLAIVPPPYKQSHMLGNWFTGCALKAAPVFQCFHFTPYFLDASLMAQYILPDQQRLLVAIASVRRFHCSHSQDDRSVGPPAKQGLRLTALSFKVLLSRQPVARVCVKGLPVCRTGPKPFGQRFREWR